MPKGEKTKELWSNPQYRSRMLASRRTPEHRNYRRELRRRLCSDSKFIEKLSKAVKTSWRDPKIRSRHLEGMRSEKYINTRRKSGAVLLNKDPDAIARRSATLRKGYASGRIKPRGGGGYNGNIIKGWYTSAQGRRCYYQSSWEKRVFELLDFFAWVKAWEKDPFPIAYRFGGRRRSYFPDFWIEVGRKNFIVELKPKSMVNDAMFAAKCRAAKSYGQKVGASFIVINTPEEIYGLRKLV